MRKNTLLYILLPLLLILSCKPQVPGKYIQPDEFEKILYDFHLADAMAEDDDEGRTDQYRIALNRQAVLKKYGISQAEFDSSLVYYTRHADRLHKIYENLSKRLSDEALALGASANDINRYGDLKSARDTSNLWRGVSSCVLMPDAPYNVMSFDIAADTTYHVGDKIIFSFNCDFIFRDGAKEAVALLAVEFKNDSVASSVVRVSSNSDYSVTVADHSNKGIKSIRGFVYLDRKNKDRTDNTLRLMSVYNIRLVKMKGTGQTVKDVPETQLKTTSDTALKPKKAVSELSVEPVIERKQVVEKRKTEMPSGKTPLKMRDIAPRLRQFPEE